MPIVHLESGADFFTLSVAQPQHVDLDKSLTLPEDAQVTLFTSAQGPGISLWAVDAANAALLDAGDAFQGILLNPNGQFGLAKAALPAGTWYFGATDYALSGS